MACAGVDGEGDVAARFLEILSNTQKTSAEIFQEIPDSHSTHEYKIKAKDIREAAELVAKFTKNANKKIPKTYFSAFFFIDDKITTDTS